MLEVNFCMLCSRVQQTTNWPADLMFYRYVQLNIIRLFIYFKIRRTIKIKYLCIFKAVEKL
jgi:hypothetical protein